MMLRVLLLVALFTATTAWGQSTAPAVSVSQLDAAVEQASASLPADDPVRESLLKYYSDTRAALLSLDQYKTSLEQYTRARDKAQGEAQAIQAELAGIQAIPEKADAGIAKAPLPELEKMIQVAKSESAALKGRLADINAELDGMPGRTIEIRARLTELVGDLSELDVQQGLLNKSPESGSEAEARLWLALAESASGAAEKASLDEELLSQPMRRDLLKAQQDKVIHDAGDLEKRLALLERQAGVLRQGEAAQARAEAELVRAGTQGKHHLVQQLADANTQLTEAFSDRGGEIEGIHQQDAATKKQAEQLEADLKTIERKLEILGMTTAVGEILREQGAQLPSPRETKKSIASVTSSIRDSSLRQINLGEERRQLRDTKRFVADLTAAEPPEIVAEITADMQELARIRRDLVGQARDLENTYSAALGDLEFTLHRHEEAVDHYRDFISERLLWMPSRETFSMSEEGVFSGQLLEMFAPSRWVAVLKVLPAELWSQPLTLVLLLFVLGLVYVTPRLVKQLEATGQHVGYLRKDQFSNTLQALGISVLLSVKWPLLMLLVAWLFELQESDSELATALFVAFGRSALYFWGLEFQRLVLLPNGLVAAHFRWPARRTANQYRRVVRLEQTFVPAAFLVVLSMNLYPREVGGPMGALAVIAVLFSISHFFRKMPHFVQGKMDMVFVERQPERTAFMGTLIRFLLIWVPLAAIVAVFLGYTYTAIEFALLLIKTVILYTVLLLLHELGLRWLRVTRRHMLMKVREEQAQARGEDAEASIEEEILENDPELLSDEGTKLLNAMVVIGGVLGVVLIWAEVFPALAVLESVELWQQTGVIDGREAIVPVTLADLLSATGLGFLGWIALRRIPSLLEILLRQRVHVSAASAYAATRVFQYSATTILVIMVLSTLGGSWSQIQWAVAALSVGIGFGLQEIVANFISGLIILFEQPIRVGDTVTVGQVSGKVTKIRIRATTIRDWDRRELLVPNKEFVTGQLLNWSLSDPVTRCHVEVGVAYGTDVTKAMGIVRQAAREHPLVLSDPEPLITFDEFGDNSLLITIRFFLEELDKRLSTASEVRVMINERFNELGIVVAFPQRDVHLDTSEPLEVTMVDKGALT